VIGAQVGGAIGLVSGSVVGTANGVVLSALDRTDLFRHGSARRVAVVTGIVVAVTGLAVQFALFGRLPGRAPRIALVYVPTFVGVIAAAILSRRLPPASRSMRDRY
jgi:hypothetical protein